MEYGRESGTIVVVIIRSTDKPHARHYISQDFGSTVYCLVYQQTFSFLFSERHWFIAFLLFMFSCTVQIKRVKTIYNIYNPLTYMMCKCLLMYISQDEQEQVLYKNVFVRNSTGYQQLRNIRFELDLTVKKPGIFRFLSI